jgi:hypothetical protein
VQRALIANYIEPRKRCKTHDHQHECESEKNATDLLRGLIEVLSTAAFDKQCDQKERDDHDELAYNGKSRYFELDHRPDDIEHIDNGKQNAWDEQKEYALYL